ncbi:MAG: PAS domain S-box protein [Variovorax sp.]|nr:MAG: PAS domain S-box protein [Variovorax sp.]
MSAAVSRSRVLTWASSGATGAPVAGAFSFEVSDFSGVLLPGISFLEICVDAALGGKRRASPCEAVGALLVPDVGGTSGPFPSRAPRRELTTRDACVASTIVHQSTPGRSMEHPYLQYSVHRPVALQLLSFADEEVLGPMADIIFTDEDHTAHAAKHVAPVAREPGRAADNPFHQRKDGTRFWASGATMLMRDAKKGQAVGFVKMLRDHTQIRKAQPAAEQSQAELVEALRGNQLARQALEAADAAKDRFLAVLSHELRHPLASIASAATLTRRPPRPIAVERRTW